MAFEILLWSLGLCAVVTILSTASVILYNLYFHPLSSYPGPKAWAATRLTFVWYSIHGTLPYQVLELHKIYGPVVRTAPDELSYTTSSAWKDVFQHRAGHKEFAKDPLTLTRPVNGVQSISGANHADHSRFRRLLAPAFSDKGIREQNPLILKCVDLLVHKLREHAGQGSQNMVDWYTWTTFDIIGDLAFGEPFHCLRDVATHPWIASMFGNIKAGPIISAFHRFGLSFLVSMLAPKKLLQQRIENYEFAVAKIDRRLKEARERGDFWDKVVAHVEEKGTGMTRDEMVSSASVFVLAGSETTATLLSGVTYLLLKHPEVMVKLVKELRTTFKDDSEINMLSTGKLEYMLAVLDETMRIYPPAVLQPARVVPSGGDTVCGNWVPEGTSISMQQYASYHLQSNFHRPEEFLPQRWLGDAEFVHDDRTVLQPFSTGPRNCIGRNLAYAEMRLILAKVLFLFDLELDESTGGSWLDQKAYSLLWEKRPLWVRLSPVQGAWVSESHAQKK